MSTQRDIQLTVNGETHRLSVQPHETLVQVLRDRIGLTGTKLGCAEGECGACTVLVNGKAVNSCLTLAVRADGKEILTIEGVARNGQLDPIQAALIETGAVQCGYCLPGLILTARAMLNENPGCTEDEAKEYLRGNLCRCTGYVKLMQAIMSVAAAGK